MRIFYIVLVIMSFATELLAQKSFILQCLPKQGFISLSGGPNLPTGHFACRQVSNQQAGLARSGQVISLAAGYRVLGKLGLMARYQQQLNPMDATALLHQPYIQSADMSSASAGQWTMNTLLLGPYFSLPISRFSVDLRALAGPALANCPANRVEGWLDTVPMSLNTSAGQARSLAYSGGLTLSYRLGRNVAAQLNTEYSSATFRFANMVTTGQEGTATWTATADGQKTISVFNVSAGLTFLFGNRYRPF